MTTYRIAQHTNGYGDITRIDLPEFQTVQEAADFIFLELFDWNYVNHFVTPIEKN